MKKRSKASYKKCFKGITGTEPTICRDKDCPHREQCVISEYFSKPCVFSTEDKKEA